MDDHPVGPPLGTFVLMLAGNLFLMLVLPMLLLDWVSSFNVVEVSVVLEELLP